MSRNSSTVSLLSVSLAIVTSVTALAAGTKLANAEVTTNAPQAERQQQIAEAQPERQAARDTSNLRCWQEGELLFEQTHLKNKKLSDKNNIMVFEDDGSSKDRELYLIDVGTATCLYEKI